MTPADIQAIIQTAMPDAQVEVQGEGNKFMAKVTSKQFDGLSRVKQHQLVNATLKEHIGSAELHALQLVTKVAD